MSKVRAYGPERLGNLIDVKYGKALPKARRRGGEVPVFGSNGIVGQHDQAVTSGPAIIIGRKGSSGAINVSSSPCWPIDTTYFIEEPGPFTFEFLNFLLRSLGLTELDRSTAIPGLNRDQLYDIEVLVPSLSDQGKVVDMLTHSNLLGNSAGRHFANARRAISRFRQAVLAAACSGRLTAAWRDQSATVETENDIAASLSDERERRLGRRYKASEVPASNLKLPNGWCWTTVGALVNVGTGATPLRTNSKYFGGTIPWVTSGSVNAGLITEPSEYITELAIKETNAKVFPAGTLLVAMYGEGQTRGRVAELGIEAATNQAVAALLFDEQSECLRGYLKLFFLEYYERIRQLSFGGVQPNLSLSVIRDTPIPLPPYDEQQEIVKRVNQLTEHVNNVRGCIAEADRRVTQSTQAILTKAFQGELGQDSR